MTTTLANHLPRINLANAARQNLLPSSIPVGYHASIMKSWKVILLLLVLAAGLAIGGGVSMLHNGLRPHATPTAMEALLARNARHLAIPPNARNERNPVTPSDQNLQEAMVHFADYCSPCHRNDGSGDTLYGKGLYPKPPDLRLAETQKLSDGELFWIIENGIRFTGMPSFAPPHGSQDDWKLALFIRHLPQLTMEERGDGAQQPEIGTRTRKRL
jgi:mono/diheme cytochrome c family protein